jgi:site-specific DNA-methyltransferase (adenine-specific)
MHENTLKSLFSSNSNEWATPQDFFNLINKEFSFELDTASTKENAKCKKFFTEKDNGLLKEWKAKSVWCNPPYGKATGHWIKKAYEETQKGNADQVVVLIPSRTDTKYFSTYGALADELRFVKGRLKFGEATSAAPFPSVLFIFRKNRKYKNTKVSFIEKKEK